MSRLKIPNGANELSYNIFVKQNNYFMIILLPYICYSLLKWRTITFTHTHTHIYIYIYIYLSLISYDQPQHDRNFARNLIFANYVTKKSHSKVIQFYSLFWNSIFPELNFTRFLVKSSITLDLILENLNSQKSNKTKGEV